MEINSPSSEINLRQLSLENEDEIFSLEQKSYPEDEAASRDRINMRLHVAPEYFCGAYLPDGTWIGYLNGTLSKESVLDHDSMFKHEREGEFLCIHSVVIKPQYQRKGYAKKMVEKYCELIKSRGKVKEIILICKDHLIPLYASCGFRNCGKSHIDYGATPWTEMRLTLH